MRVLRWLGILLGTVLVAAVAIAIAARFSDGPLGPFAGGPLTSGELVTDPHPDWSFVRDVREVELQLLEPPRSRTTWILLHEGRIYIPCGLPSFRLWKQWPHEAERDGRALLRIGDKRYPRQAVRVTDPAVLEALVERAEEKYPSIPEAMGPDDVWFFRLDPRPVG
jgi:hypothetical protein